MRVTFLVLAILISESSDAQYLFHSLQTKDGLSSQSVTALLRDSDGFLWLGTQNGLNRFDGSSVKVYNWAHHNYPLDQSEIINDIVEIQSGKLLIGTRSGLFLFSTYDKQFTDVPTAPGINKDLMIHSMVMDPQRNTWIASPSELYLYMRDTVFNAAHVFAPIAELYKAVTFTGQIALDTLRHGIWMCTDHGLCLIDYTTGEYNTYWRNTRQLPIFRDAPIGTFALDVHSGDIWWGDSQDVLVHYQVADKTLRYHNEQMRKYGALNSRVAYLDARGRMWFSTWTGRLFVLEPSGTVSVLPEETIEPYVLKSGFVNDVMEEDNGDIWFGTGGGAARLAGSNIVQDVIDLPYNNDEIIALTRMDESRLLIASNAGMVIYDETTKHFELYKVNEGNQHANRVFTIQSIGDEWWCGTGSGIYIYNPATRRFRPLELLPYTQEIRKRSVTVLLQDSQGQIWFTTWGGYLYRFDPTTQTCIRFDGAAPQHGDIGRANCLALTEDVMGRIWLGYGEKGLRIYTGSTYGFEKVTGEGTMQTSVVSNFFETPDHLMWVSTWGDGLYLLDMEGNVLKHLTSQHGLSSNFTTSATADAAGRLWFGTPEAIHNLNSGSLSANKINFNIEVSLGDDWVALLIEDRFIYATLRDRLLVIDPVALEQPDQPDLPLISAIHVFEEEVPYSPITPDLHLKYNENFFRIEFSSPQHAEYPSLTYAYIMEGFNRDWVYCGRQLSASFTNVPHGEYRFRVKSSDQNGKFYDEDRHFAVIIQPPFWETTWFYLLCTIGIVYGLYLLYRRVQHRQVKRKSDQIIDYFANSVYSENSVNEICWDIARNCISQLGFQDCVVFLMNEERSHVVQKAAFGPKYPKGSDNLNPLRIPVGQGIIGTVAAQGRPLLIPDTSKDPRYIADDTVRLSEISVPIMHDQKVIGVIDSEHPDKQFFTQEHLKTLSTIASISAYKIADAQAQMLAQANELKLLELNTLFAESQLKALRAQMNPHFVFNCLNSIQECIVTKKYSEASAYLNRFAKLFRLVLNNSGKMLITIDEEAEILTLYLELELMRFDHSFTYIIDIDPALESDDILMPSMFMQPFVENALWHGLMHKDKDRRLEVSFKRLSEDVFACTVDDNGIGRKASAEYRKKRVFGQSYDSKGMKMNLERIEILRRQGFHATLYIIDKDDSTGTASGTTVVAEFSNNLTYQ